MNATEGLEVGGVVVGGTLGAALGGLLGSLLGHPGWGMLLGAGAGGAGGYVAGRVVSADVANAVANTVKSVLPGGAQFSATYAQTGTTMSVNVGDTLTAYLPGPNAWTFTLSDPSVLTQGSSGTAPDPSNTTVTDQTTMFTAVSEGSTVISGTSGSQTWKLTVNVST